MARSKKSRKVGLIGVRKDPDRKPGKPKPASAQKPKKHKGKPAGNRHNVEQSSSGHSQSKQAKDPRVGSKKPIDLTPPTASAPAKQTRAPKYATPEQELAALEADTKLAALLDKLDDDQAISKAEQAYVDEKMARHRVVCELLGITDYDDEEEDDDDPLDGLDAIDIDDYKR